jgi:hypothetical protein
MMLEMGEFPVKRVILGNRFAYRAESLEVDEAELLALVRGTRAFATRPSPSPRSFEHN